MEKKFKFRDAEIFYKVTGAGQPVALLHGFAEDNTIWKEQVSFLQDYCRLILPDLPGSGQSSMLQSNDITIEDYAACINALLENEGIDKCVLLGHSMGGYITLAFAEMFPDKLKAFGLVHSSAFADNEEKIAVRQKGITMMEEQGVFSFLENTTPNSFSENYKKNEPAGITALVEQGKSFSKEALIQYYTAMMHRPDRTAVLEKSKVPVLFITGSEDAVIPTDDLLKQVHLPKISYIHIIKDAGHMSMQEKPAELNNYLLEFVRNTA